MKNKKIVTYMLIGISIIILLGCLITQIIIKNDTKKLDKEKEKFETLVAKTKSGTEIETNYTHIDDQDFYIKVPLEFKQLEKETINQKYQGNVPNIVFSNKETTINVVISTTKDEMKNEQIPAFKDQMEKTLKNQGEILEAKTYQIDNHNIGAIKVITNAKDTKIYNDMLFFSYHDKLVIISFNCTEELKEEYKPIGDFITSSLFFSEK